MEKTWSYLVNTFLSITETSFKKALKLSNYHDAMLLKVMTENPGDPDWTTLYNRYHPFHTGYVNAYNNWKNAGGFQEGQTLNVRQMLVLLIAKVGRWDAQVQIVFEKKSPTYLTIFPDGHAPFTKGGITPRIQAVQTLSLALTPHAALLATKTEVDDFYTVLDNARDTQEGAKGNKTGLSAVTEQSRITTMTEQYRDLGFLINKLAETPLLIAPFFELLILRDHRQVVFTGTLDVGEIEPVLIHTFVDDDVLTFEITATGTGNATFYLATTPGGTDSTPVQVTANTAKLEITAAQFGINDYGTHRYLTAINNSAIELHYEVELK